jgi:hypothetical protein
MWTTHTCASRRRREESGFMVVVEKGRISRICRWQSLFDALREISCRSTVGVGDGEHRCAGIVWLGYRDTCGPCLNPREMPKSCRDVPDHPSTCRVSAYRRGHPHDRIDPGIFGRPQAERRYIKITKRVVTYINWNHTEPCIHRSWSFCLSCR